MGVVESIGVALVGLGLAAVLLTLLGTVFVRRPFLALAALAVVTPFGSTIKVPAPPPLENLSSLVGAFAVAAFAGHLLISGRPPVRTGPAPATWALLLAWAAVTTLWSGDPSLSIVAVSVLLVLVILLVLVAMTPVTAADVRAVEIGLVVSGVITGLYATYLAATGALATAVDSRFVAAIGGSETDSISDPNITAASLLLPFFVAAGIAAREGKLRTRALAAASAAITFLAIFLTGSRGGLLALIVGLGTIVWTSPNRRRVIAALALPVIAVVLAVSLAPSAVTQRVSQDSRSSGRTDIWKIGLRSCPDNCLLGAGWGTFSDVHREGLLTEPQARGVELGFEAHSIWVDTLVSGGVIGVVLLVSGLLLTFKQTSRTPRGTRGPPRAALIAAVIAGSLIATFSFKYFWLVLIYVTIVHNVRSSDRCPSVEQLPERSGPHELARA